jgi:hypothetical protein
MRRRTADSGRSGGVWACCRPRRRRRRRRRRRACVPGKCGGVWACCRPSRRERGGEGLVCYLMLVSNVFQICGNYSNDAKSTATAAQVADTSSYCRPPLKYGGPCVTTPRSSRRNMRALRWIELLTVLVWFSGGAGLAHGQVGVAVTTLAGAASFTGSTDWVGPAARFNYPTGVAMDAAGAVAIVVSTTEY